METTTMGRVTTAAKIENLQDEWAAKRGLIKSTEVRCVEVPDALVDTGAMRLALPTGIIQRLGLSMSGERPSLTANGIRVAKQYDPVRLTIMGRDCIIDVVEVPDVVPVLIGQVPLELLDFVVDPSRQTLIPNPRYGGEQVIEML
jgi:predicted aspartyl protease